MQATFTASALEFARAVGNAAVFAGTDKILPVLNAVRLEVSEPDQNAEAVMTAVATDRYTIGIDTAKVTSVTTATSILVGLADVQRIVKAVKGLGRTSSYLFVVAWIEDDGRVKFDIGYDSSVIIRPIDGEFPKYRSLLPTTEPVPTGTIAWNTAYLSRFDKVQSGHATDPVRLDLYGPTKPAMVRKGDTFTGLIMPVRLAS